MALLDQNNLYYQQFLSRENNTGHHKYDEEVKVYRMVQEGNPEAVGVLSELFLSDRVGKFLTDRLQDKKYLFVASITLITRFAIEGGLDEEIAYTISDLYIQKVHLCNTVNEIMQVYKDMIVFFITKMQEARKTAVSKPVADCMDYIYFHLHEDVRVQTLADHVGMNANYLSGLFKRETGQTISAYITGRRMEAAKNMLQFSNLSYAEISAVLSFSSQSYFIKVFQENVGMTPRQFRNETAAHRFEARSPMPE